MSIRWAVVARSIDQSDNHQGAMMTILHSGASGKFANNWLKIFDGKKAAAKAGGKARGASSTAKSTKQKAKAPRAGKPAAKKKSVAKKSRR
jgi:hypothetical protein